MDRWPIYFGRVGDDPPLGDAVQQKFRRFQDERGGDVLSAIEGHLMADRGCNLTDRAGEHPFGPNDEHVRTECSGLAGCRR